MSFGLRDQDWVDPPEPETFKAHCRDCTNCRMCPCGDHGFCTEIGEYVEPDEVITVGEDCDTFDPSSSFDPDWQIWQAADEAYDAYKDRQMEESYEQ